MHNGSQDRRQFSLSTANSVALCVVGVAGGTILYLLGRAQKWDAATVGTIAPFWYVASVFRRRWTSQPFWIILSLCLAAHLVAVGAIFGILLRAVYTEGLLPWLPMLMIEGLSLYALFAV